MTQWGVSTRDDVTRKRDVPRDERDPYFCKGFTQQSFYDFSKRGVHKDFYDYSNDSFDERGDRVNKGIGLTAHWTRGGIDKFFELHPTSLMNHVTTTQ